MKDGSAYLKHIFFKRFTSITDRQKLNFINTPTALDQAISFQRFISVKLLEECNVPQNKLFELLAIHTCPPDDFGRSPDHLSRVSRCLEKNSQHYLDAINKQISVDELLKDLPSGPSEINGTGPAPSPRTIMERALVKKNEALFKKVAKIYNISDAAKAFIKLKTFIKYKDLNEQIEPFCSDVSSKMPLAALADICYGAGYKKAAFLLIDKMSNDEKKLDKLVAFEMYPYAAKLAHKLKNVELANELDEKAKTIPLGF